MTENELMSPEMVRDQVKKTTDDLWTALRAGDESQIVETAGHLKALVDQDQKVAIDALRKDPERMDDVILRLFAVRAMNYGEIGEIFGLSKKSVGSSVDRAIKAQEELSGKDPRQRLIVAAVASYREVMRTLYPKMAAGSIQATKNYLNAQDNLCRLLGLNAPDRKMVALGGMGPQLVQVFLPPKDEIGTGGEIVDSVAVEVLEGDEDDGCAGNRTDDIDYPSGGEGVDLGGARECDGEGEP